MIDPQKFSNCFINWTNSICKLSEGEVVSIDEKALNWTAEPSKGKYNKKERLEALVESIGYKFVNESQFF